jgi:hypothetical protein
MIRRKMPVAVSAALFVVVSAFAYADAKEDVVAAAKKVAAESYSWKSTTEGGQFNSTAEGKVQKDGLMWMSRTFGENTIETVKMGDKAAVKTQDGWKSAEELADAQGPERFFARAAQTLRAPAQQAQEVAEKVQKVEKSDDAYTAALTEEQAKAMMAFGRRGGGGQGPQVANAKGTAKFWVKDGALSKVQFTVSGTMTINNEDRDINRTTTSEIKDVGSTKVDVPAEAKGKLK